MAIKKLLLGGLIAFLLLSTVLAAHPLNGEPNTSFDIQDINGNTVHFDKPVTKVVTLGVGLTQTVMDLGCSDAILGVDFYSSAGYTGNQEFSSFKSLGNYYNKDGRDLILTTLVQMQQNGEFTPSDMVIIAPNYSYIYTATDNLISMIREAGLNFKVVMLVSSSMTYDGVVNMVGNIGKILNAPDTESVVKKMTDTENYVKDIISTYDLSGVPALHLTSAAIPTFYNRSMLLSMVTIAGGFNAGDNGSSSASHAEDFSGIIQKIGEYGKMVIFLDSGNPYSAPEFKEKIGNPSGVRVVKGDPKWNNACPIITEGLLVFASALHPNYFDADVPSDNVGEGSVAWYISAGAGIVFAVIIGVVATVLLRRN